jgi:hypothetical protein
MIPQGFNWGAHERWEDRTEAAAYDDPLKRCRKFPDCRCSYCHGFHIEINEFNPFCSDCKNEKCEACDGTGWELTDGNAECPKCKSTGRIRQ